MGMPRRLTKTVLRILPAVMFVLAATCTDWGQKPVGGASSGSSGQMPMPASNQGSGNPRNALNPAFDLSESPFPDTIAQKRNSERQRRIVSDTERLVALTNQLKAELAVSTGETLTPEMLHQMEEIEKLARSVKDRMRD